MSEDDNYVCTLDEAALRTAKEELYEDPKDRMSSVKKFRQWILEQKHLKCRTDTEFLLMYLRGAKFSQLRARELIENSMRVMTEIPEWFRSIDPKEAGVMEYLKLGVLFVLPKRDPNNRRIVVIRPGAISVKNKYYGIDNEMRAGYCAIRYIIREELTQVYGYVLIFDYSNFTTKHVKASWTSDSFKKQATVWQDCTPGRVKAFHVYNGGLFIETMMTLARPFMKKKVQRRFQVHDNLESLYRHIPKECLPQEYVPDDFKDHVGTTQSVIDNFISELTSEQFRQEILNSTKPEYGMDMSLLPSNPEVESYRKIETD